jgi:hypothetical protein
MKARREFDTVAFSTGATVNDYARAYRIEVSDDNTNWTPVLSSDSGSPNTVAQLGSKTDARYIKLTQTNSSNWWEINELKVYNGYSESEPPPADKAVPGKIEAEDYDSMNGVQTENTSDTGEGSDVGWIDAGDWMDYNVNVAASGTYTVKFRVASENGADGALQLKQGDSTLCTLDVPATGGWQNWTTIIAAVTLPEGPQTLRVSAGNSGYNINWFEFAEGASDPPPEEKGNPVINPSFEDNNGYSQTVSGWHETANTDASFVEDDNGAHTGSYHGTHRSADSYQAYTYQIVNGLENGNYTLKAWVRSSGGQNAAKFEAKNFGSSTMGVDIPESDSWTQLEIPDINVTNGQIEISFYSDASANQWIHFDDVELSKQ